MLALIFSAQASAAVSAPRTFKEAEITFAEYTEGASAAFDGDKDTGYTGSITGMFAKRTVLTGITVRASSPIVGLKVSGSENGVDWVELHSQKNVSTIAILGSNGSGSVSDTTCDSMYTYSLKYLRVEMEYGAIGEIKMYGYETDVEGYISELDTSFGTDGYESSGSYYTDYARMPYVLDHTVHSSAKGEVITYKFLDAAQKQKYAYLTLKAEGSSPITEIALMHKDDKNVTRWDGVRVEVSADGKSWVEVTTFPDNLSTQTNLRARTVMIVDVPDDGAYTYARISSTKSSISICVMDLYTKCDVAPQVPENVLKGWEGDPFKSVNAPADTKDGNNTEGNSQTSAEDDSTAESTAEEGKSGCGSAVVAVSAPIAVCSALAALCPKRRKRK